MEKTISMRAVRERLSEVGGMVHYTKQPVVVERNGKEFFVMISPEDYAQYQQLIRDQAWAAVERTQKRNSNIDPEEVLRDVTDAVEAVRRDRYDRTT